MKCLALCNLCHIIIKAHCILAQASYLFSYLLLFLYVNCFIKWFFLSRDICPRLPSTGQSRQWTHGARAVSDHFCAQGQTPTAPPPNPRTESSCTFGITLQFKCQLPGAAATTEVTEVTSAAFYLEIWGGFTNLRGVWPSVGKLNLQTQTWRNQNNLTGLVNSCLS